MLFCLYSMSSQVFRVLCTSSLWFRRLNPKLHDLWAFKYKAPRLVFAGQPIPRSSQLKQLFLEVKPRAPREMAGKVRLLQGAGLVYMFSIVRFCLKLPWNSYFKGIPLYLLARNASFILSYSSYLVRVRIGVFSEKYRLHLAAKFFIKNRWFEQLLSRSWAGTHK